MLTKHLLQTLPLLIILGIGGCKMNENYLTYSSFDEIKNYLKNTGVVKKASVYINNNILDFYITFHEQYQTDGYLNISKKDYNFFFEISKLQEKENNLELLIEVYEKDWVDYKKKFNYKGNAYKKVNIYFKQILEFINNEKNI